MAITLIGTHSGSNNNGGDCTINFTAIQNDIVLVMGGTAGSGGDAGVSTSGYTELIDNRNSTVEFSVNWKRMSSSPDSSVVCTGSGVGTDATAYVVMVFRGVDTSTAIDATSTEDEGNSDKPNSPSITTVTNGAAVISCFIQGSDEINLDPPGGYSDSVEIHRSESKPVTVGAAWNAVIVGAENPNPWDSATSAPWAAATIALRPAVATIAIDGVLSATAIANVSLIGSVGSSMRLAATGTGTASWTGTSLATQGALAATGTATVAFEGEGGGWGSFAMTPTVTVSWVGGKEYMSSVREVIESRGAASVTVH
jgi:hypothetical protein